MAKFTAEEKLQAVQRYINRKESFREIGESIGVYNTAKIVIIQKNVNTSTFSLESLCTSSLYRGLKPKVIVQYIDGHSIKLLAQ